MRALVAEDEPRLARQLGAALSGAGYVVDGADDGERADFLAQTERYDVVVLDLGLPKIDGPDVTASLADAAILTPVLVLTARGKLAREGDWHRFRR